MSLGKKFQAPGWFDRRHPLLESLGTMGAGLLYAVALKWFVFPAKVILTGTEGIAASLAYYFESEALFLVLYAVAQTALILFAFAKISRIFAIRTLLTVGTVLVALPLLPEMRFADPGSSNERILLVLFGGILAGFAKAISLRLRGSTGDEDILGAYFAMKYLKPVGSIAVLAAVVSTTFGLSLDLWKFRQIEPVVNTLMYTSIYIFASAETLNNFFRKFKLTMLTVAGGDTEAIGRAIHSIAPHRTWTIVEGLGGYSNEPLRIVRTVLTHEELREVMDAVEKACPDAFHFHHDIEGISRRYYIKPIG
jgi:uncharacterized membrane-anchored protein YitT (DUF2179 family)